MQENIISETKSLSKKVLFSKDQLYDLYTNKKLSSYQIGKMYNVSYSTILRWLKKYNIPTRSISEARTKVNIPKKQLYDLYINQKLSTEQIAKMFNACHATILYKLKKYNISTRSYSEANHLSKANHVSLSKEAIEWINGELLGDGCLGCDGSKYSARFKYDSKYKEYIEYVSRTLDSFGIKQSGKIFKRVITQFKSKTEKRKFKRESIAYQYHSLSYEELYSLYKKWYPEGKKIVPRDIELTPLTCRQWMIGDGSLIHPKNANSSIVLCTCGFTIKDVEFLAGKLRELGFKAKRQPSHNTIHISSYSTLDFLNYIGKCPVKCYQYKWNSKIIPESIMSILNKYKRSI